MSNKDCKFCDKKGLMILPLRYSVATADDVGKELDAIPALPGNLGEGVKDLTLTNGKYVPALLRTGYLYVLIDRKGIKSWDAYCVTSDAYLAKFPAESPPATKIEFSCDPTVCGIDASMVSIDKAADVEKVYFLFTPDPLTKAKLKEYKDDPDGMVAKKRMQVFNPKVWLAGTTKQPHALAAADVPKHTREGILYAQAERALTSPLGNALADHLFPPVNAAYAGIDPAKNGGQPAGGRLGVLYQSMYQRKAAGFVIYDHIGITQELNNFRNAALDSVQQFLDRKDLQQVSNERKYASYEAIEEVKNGFTQAIYTSRKEQVERARERSEEYLEMSLEYARRLRARGDIASASNLEQDVARRRASREKVGSEYLENAKAEGQKRWQKYERLLNKGEMDTLYSQLNFLIDQAKTKAGNARAEDHLKWLQAERLLDAFDAFDELDQKSGFSFAAHAAACTFGMGGIDKCAALLDQWISAKTIDRKNLFMRAFAYNQRDLKKEIEQAIAQAQAAAAGATPGMINWGLAQKAAKGLVDAFKKVDSAWDEYARNTTQRGAAFAYEFERLAYKGFSEIGRTMFRVGLGNKGDAALVAGLGTLLYGRSGEIAEKLRLEELMYRIDPEHPLAPELSNRKKGNANLPTTTEAGHPRNINREAAAEKARLAKEKVSSTLESALEKGTASNFHQVRVGVIITLLEAINISSQMAKANKTSEDYIKMAGTAFSLVSVSVDLAYTGAKLIREHAPDGASRAAIRGAGETVRGGLKLASGGFSLLAGLISAYLDWGQFKDDIQNKNVSWLTAIYFFRAGASIGSSYFAITAGLSYCGTWISHLSLRVAQSSSQKGTAIAAGNALVKLGQRVALLRWVARFNLIGFALTLAEVGIRVFVLDDALENWCRRSVFRLEKSDGLFGKKPFQTQDDELNALFSAYEEIH